MMITKAVVLLIVGLLTAAPAGARQGTAGPLA